MKQEKKRTTLYLTPDTDRWLTEKAQKDGLTKTGLLQIIISKAKENEAARQ